MLPRCLCVFGEALFLRYGAPRLCSARRAALWRLYLDPCVSLVLAASIGRAAWPVGRRAAWNLLDGAPADAAELRGKLAAIDGVECVEAAALLRLSDAPELRRRRARVRRRVAGEAPRAGLRLGDAGAAAGGGPGAVLRVRNSPVAEAARCARRHPGQ